MSDDDMDCNDSEDDLHWSGSENETDEEMEVSGWMVLYHFKRPLRQSITTPVFVLSTDHQTALIEDKICLSCFLPLPLLKVKAGLRRAKVIFCGRKPANTFSIKFDSPMD
ncbi:hypothetical protein CPB85DRAFT_1259549 [Mucidula mucida]|nr:hypothetical protein CPB85DRAFT_1259549 [Mucidula mucida]